MNEEVSRTAGKTFNRTAYHVMTKAGGPKLAFGYGREKTIFGSWQGATKSVISWTSISFILQRYTKKGGRGNA